MALRKIGNSGAAPATARQRARPPIPALTVGVGFTAEATGAVASLLEGLAPEHGMAVVCVAEGGAEATLPATTIEDGMALERGAVYLCPPGHKLRLSGGHFMLSEIPEGLRHGIIDDFFRSLAEDQGGRSVGILLGHTWGDGILGFAAIAEAGGLTLAQEPPEQEAAAEPGGGEVTDQLLDPPAMAERLVQHLQAAHRLSARAARAHDRAIAESIGVVCDLLREATGQDFRHYKTSTLLRRIRRRMQVCAAATVEEYLARLKQNPEEALLLRRDVLIGVTSFFRDRDAFEALEERFLPRLLAEHSGSEPVRVWIPGCATGEEAYSLAILLREAAERLPDPPELQVFATDVHERALAVARAGHYGPAIADQVGPERLRRFFTRRGNRYHVNKELREICLFSVHNLISDPPFSRLDLLSCRNVLIYLGPHLQKKLMGVFHYALKPGGLLFLGPSESVAQHKDLFQVLDARQRIAQRKRTSILSSPAAACSAPRLANPPGSLEAETEADVGRIAQRILLDEFAPRYVVVNGEGHVVYASPETGAYLQPAAGPFDNSVVKMARGGLRMALRSALKEVCANGCRTIRNDIVLRGAGEERRVRLTVQPMPRLGEESDLYLVVFEERGPAPALDGALSAGDGFDTRAAELVEQLEQELRVTREELENSIQEIEVSNEELKSSNEELLSMNEELQSANEELETSKEEVQAANESLARAHADLENLFESTRVATVFLDAQWHIRSFTPAISRIYNLRPVDIGRPLSELTHKALSMPPLPDLAAVREAGVLEEELQTVDGAWFRRRTLPYRTLEGGFGGIVMTFIDVTSLHESRELIARQLTEIEAVYRTAPVGLAVVDRNLVYRRMNDQMADWLGKRPEEVIGHSPHEAVPAMTEILEPAMRRALETGEPVRNIELSLESPQRPGEICHWLRSLYPLRNEDGEITGLNIVGQDITARRRMEEEIRRGARHLHNVLDSLFAFVAVLTPDGIVVDANRVLLEAASLDSASVVGRPFWEAYWWSHDPDVQERLRAAIERGARGRVSRYDEHIRLGESLFVTIDFQLVPMRDEEGRITHLVPSGIDISERKQMEEELQHARDQLAAIINTMDQGLVVVRPDGTFVVMNPAATRMLQVDRDAPPRARVADFRAFTALFDLEGREIPFERWPTNRALAGEVFSGDEIEIRRLDTGHRFLARVGGAPVRGPEGSSELAIITMSDVTLEKENELALRAGERALAEANRNKDTFLAMLGHELRNPLAALTAAMRFMEPGNMADGGNDGVAWHEMMRRQVVQLGRLLDDLLDVNRITRGKIRLRCRTIDLRATASQAVDAVREPLEARGHRLRVELPESPLAVHADPARLEQVIVNLLLNAVKYTPEGGEIELCAAASGDQVELRVTDNGAGMDAETLARAFDMFSQAEATLDRAQGGLGIGLTLVRNLVALHGGTSEAHSDGLGKGSSFTVRLPAAPEGALALAEEELARPPAAATTARRVLVLDDNVDLAAGLAHMLRAAGHTVELAHEGHAGLEHARAFRPEVMVLDIGLPGLNGFQVAERLRAMPECARIRIIAVSGYSRPEGRDPAAEKNFDLFLKKPIDHDRLLAAVAGEFAPATPPVPLRIVLIEDHPLVAELTARGLEEAGLRVTVAHDGPKGLEAVRRELPDAVLCDLSLKGGMDGLQIARAILGGESPPPRLVALTGYDDEATRARALEAGYDLFLTKPVDPDQLSAEVEALCRAAATTPSDDTD